ncbi:GntR family transcriptional regulator [Halomonas binhaiensis]|uniref:GntR family transcriptional regulator n=1 Tax=Halomonas binhaiensis TaxID=2562282 RepID=A0A5C1ND04_9GAMM|nr:GntR family transcriptional regulator [Halomonas binhaiensis]QEM81176.1 GntR family transcriptional regulator [Halomonas binhaiensis]
MTDIPSQQNLTTRIAEEMRRKLINGDFLPGQRLSEAALAQSLDISRNTLREVFRLLTKEGLVKHERNRGVFVAAPSLASIIDIYRVRRLIECQALAQAYPQHPAHDRMQEAVARAKRCLANKDWQGVGTANMEFHMATVELADSERLNAMFTQLLVELRLVFGLLKDPEFLHAPYVGKNEQILEQLDKGEFEKAAATLNDYLVQSERIVLAEYARRMNDAGVQVG